MRVTSSEELWSRIWSGRLCSTYSMSKGLLSCCALLLFVIQLRSSICTKKGRAVHHRPAISPPSVASRHDHGPQTALLTAFSSHTHHPAFSPASATANATLNMTVAYPCRTVPYPYLRTDRRPSDRGPGHGIYPSSSPGPRRGHIAGGRGHHRLEGRGPPGSDLYRAMTGCLPCLLVLPIVAFQFLCGSRRYRHCGDLVEYPDFVDNPS